jgi:hypothetical protein
MLLERISSVMVDHQALKVTLLFFASHALNSFKMSPVKKIPCLRSQNKKAKFFHLISITCCPFNTSLHKEVSRLKSNKFDDETIFFPHLINFLFQNLKGFP